MENTKTFNFDAISENYSKMIREIRAGNSCSIFGVQNSMRPALVSNIKRKILYLTADNVGANSMFEQFRFMGQNTLLFPNTSDGFLYKKASSSELYRQRSKTLYKVLKNDYDVIVAPIESLFQFLPSVDDFSSGIVNLKSGDIINQKTLEENLIRAGYKREELISEAGQFSKRGEIIDIFPINSDVPYRIDFFDDEIETIKIFDIISQKGTKSVDSISICPCSDLFLDKNEISSLTDEISKLKKNVLNDVDLSTIFNAQIDEIISRLELGDRSYSLNCIIPYIERHKSSIFDYMKKSNEFVVVFDECKQIYDYFTNSYKETVSRIKELLASGTLVAGKRDCIFRDYVILDYIKNNTCLAFLKITNSNRFFDSKAVFSYKSIPANRYTHNLREFSIDIRHYKIKGYKIVIFAGSDEQSKNIKEVLDAHDISFRFSDKVDFSNNECVVLKNAYTSGFILPEEKIYVVGTYDIFPKKKNKNSLKSSKDTVFNIPKVGDYVVHDFHGIGICEGVTQLSGNFGTKDYVVIKYRDNDTLYVPTTNMDMLSRFTGADVPKKLSKIGGVDFSAVKEKVRESIKKIAFNLLELGVKKSRVMRSLKIIIFKKSLKIPFLTLKLKTNSLLLKK